MFEKKEIIVDCKGHLLGRLASTVAKELLNGQHIVLVRSEECLISGPFLRNKLKYMSFIRKRTNTNPTHGPFHYRAPSRIIWRAIRGMLPHKITRGAEALSRLKCFEGVPPPYDRRKRMVIPDALKISKLKSQRKTTLLGRLSHEVGWKQQETIKMLEDKRKKKGSLHYKTKLTAVNMRKKAIALAEKETQK